MNPRTLKETRILLPLLGGIMLVLVLEGLFLPGSDKGGILLTTLIIGSAFLGAISFGEEFQHRTMPMLLTQPLQRQRIWREKMVVIGLALLAAALACMLFTPPPPHNDWAWYVIVGLVPIFVLCSAPRGALLAKNSLVGALTVFSLPLGIWLGLLAVYAAVQWLCQCFGYATLRTFLDRYYYGNMLVNSFDQYYLLYLAPVVLIYLGISYRSGYRTFLSLQMIDAQAQDIRPPAKIESALAGPISKIIPGYTGPLASLIRKELRLQRAGFVLAGFLCALAAVELSLWFALKSDAYFSELFTGLLLANVILLVLVVPMVICGVCVAEEKSLGVSTAQRALPPSAAKQWLVKIAVVLGACLLLGVALPVIMVNIWYVAAHHYVAGFPVPHDAQTGLIALNAVVGYLLLMSLVMFASSASTSTLRAILLGILLVTLAGSCGVWPMGDNPVSLLNDNLRDLVLHGTPWVMICTLLLTHIFTYRNYRRIEMTGKRITWQSVAILLPMAIWGLCFYVIRNILDWTGPQMGMGFY